MIPLPLTALHDTFKAGDEPVLVTVTPWTLEGSIGVGDVEGNCGGVLGFGIMAVGCVLDGFRVISFVGDILFGSVMNTTKYNSLIFIIKICQTN